MKEKKLKKLNKKDIDRFHGDLADLLGVRRHAGCRSEQESDEKTVHFYKIMECLKGKHLRMGIQGGCKDLNISRHMLNKVVFVSNPAYYRTIFLSEFQHRIVSALLGYRPSNEFLNRKIFIVPEENVETVLLFGFPNVSV